MIKHVVFDFDGTMVDSKYITVGILNELAEKYGFKKIKEEEQEHFRSLSIFDRLKKIELPVYIIPLIAVEINQKYRQSLNNLQVVKGIEGVIGALKKKGLALSIMSSNSAGNINGLLKNKNIDAFENVYSSNHIFGKDIVIRHFLNKNKLGREEMVYIGDECRDIVACKKNGVKAIAVTWGYDSAARLAGEKPDFMVKAPGEIISVINSLAKIG